MGRFFRFYRIVFTKPCLVTHGSACLLAMHWRHHPLKPGLLLRKSVGAEGAQGAVQPQVYLVKMLRTRSSVSPVSCAWSCRASSIRQVSISR